MTTFPLQLQDLTKRDWGIWLRDRPEYTLYTLQSVVRMYKKTSRWKPQHEINILPSIWQFFLPDAKLDLVENETL